jgi:hypothetical protein
MPGIAGDGSQGAGLPSWAPTRDNVADYVPHRTLKRAETSTVESGDVYRLTFDEDTRPNGDTVDRLIGDGLTYVTGRVSPVPTGLQATASLIATLYAASAVERSWPHDEQSLQRANDMEKRMDNLLAGIIAANDAAGATVEVIAAYNFPAPVPWGDSLL